MGPFYSSPNGRPAMNDVTRILSRIEDGDGHAAEELLPLVYDDLRRLAAQKLRHEKADQTLQPTALVHEAYLRLVATDRPQRWDSKRHFYAAAAEAMRRILIENAKRKHRAKRGGQMHRSGVDEREMEIPCHVPPDKLLALDEALVKLGAEDPQKATIVKLRFFMGLSHEDAGKVLDVSTATAKRYWRYARAWLHREMRKGDSSPLHSE
jgi:RNA polymerase sigma factor (TIGR02999 family)